MLTIYNLNLTERTKLKNLMLISCVRACVYVRVCVLAQVSTTSGATCNGVLQL